MKTTRFETFFDAVLAIIITVLVLKLVQPAAPTFAAVGELGNSFLTYLTCFLILFNIWYRNHNLFQIIDEINHETLVYYGLLIFALSLFPYFAIWLAFNVNSVPAQTMFGLDFLITNIIYLFSLNSIRKVNPGQTLSDYKNVHTYITMIIILVGFVLTYTVFTQGIFFCCMISTIYATTRPDKMQNEIVDSDRFEAFIDAIVAIVLTIIVLEITLANGGSWQALFDLKLEFISYAISFLVCFNYWVYNISLFHVVRKIDYKVIWTSGISLFIISLIPYFTRFVAENFYSFAPQALYGLEHLLIPVTGIILGIFLKKADPENGEIDRIYKNKAFPITFIIVIIGYAIGYLYYPPAIIFSCLISIPLGWILTRLNNLN